MRTGYNNSIIQDEKNGDFIGINLGADHVAEHEWGITSLFNAFRAEQGEKVFGVERRRLMVKPDLLIFTEVQGVDTSQLKKKKKKEVKVPFKGLYLPRYKESKPDPVYTRDELYSAWADGDFCFFSCNEKHWPNLQKLLEEIPKRNVCMWMGGGHVFQNAGLCFGIIDRISKEVLDTWESVDRERWEVKQEMKATGIEEILKKAEKRYFALSPKRDKDGSLTFWLNPMEQNIHAAGWFKLEDLKQWAEGKGPVMSIRKRA